MSNQIGTAYVAVQPDMSGFGQGVQQQIGGVLGPLEGRFGKFGKVAAVGVAAVGAAALAAGKQLYDLGASFDDAYDRIRVGTGKTGKSLQGLEKDFKNVVKTTPTDFGKASEAIAALNSRLGLSGKPLQDTAKRLLELSRITKTDLSANIESTTRLFGDWSVSTGKQGAALDKLFRASQAANVPVAELSDVLTKFGGPLRQLGFSFDESAAMVAKFKAEGVNTELVLGSMRIALGKAAKAGKDPQEEFRKTAEAIKNAGDAGKANQLAIELFGAKAGPDMAAAIREGRFSIKDLQDQIAGGKDTILGAAKDTSDLSEKWQMFKNRVLVGLEPLATGVFNAIGSAADYLAPALDAVQRLIRNVRASLDGGNGGEGGLSGAVAKARDAMQSMGTVIQNVVTIGTALWDRFGDDIMRIASTLADYFGGVVSSVARILEGITDFVAGVLTGDWSRAWDGIKNILGGAWDAIENVINVALELIKALAAAAWDALKAAAGEAWQQIKERVQGKVRDLRDWLSETWASIRERASEVWEQIKGRASEAWNNVKERVIGAIRTARESLSEAWASIRDRASDVWASIRERAASAWDSIKDRILSAIRSARDLIDDVWASIKRRAEDAWDSLKSGASRFAEGFKDAIVDAFKSAVSKVTGFVNSIISVLNRIPGVNIGAIRSDATRNSTDDVPQFARGGVMHHDHGFGQGMQITRPMAIVGEQAPKHPEFVIPTNPAYRKRALALYARLGDELGAGTSERLAHYARGGMIGGTSIGDIAKLPLDALTGGAKWFINKLPGADGLPGWLQGAGTFALGKVTDWIKSKVKDLFGSEGGLGGSNPSFSAVTALAARFGNVVTSGYRPGDDGWHGKNRARDYAGGNMLGFARAVAAAFGSKLLELIYTPLGWGIKNGRRIGSFGAAVDADHFDHVHVALAKGGVIGPHGVQKYVGAYRNGGVVPADGMAFVHRGETVTPANAAPVVGDVYVQIGDGPVERVVDARVQMRERRLVGAVAAGVLR